MSIFGRRGDGLDSLRDVASGLRQWRPPDTQKLRLALERIERSGGSKRRPDRPGSSRQFEDLAKASRGDLKRKSEAIPLTPRDGHRIVPVAPPGRRHFSVDHPRPGRRTRKREEHWPRSLRRIARRVDRLALAARPGLLSARRSIRNNRMKLVWTFVVAVSLMTRSS